MRAKNKIKIICAQCKKRKLISEFYKDESKKNGVGSYCKECQKANVRSRRIKDPIKSRISDRRKLLGNYGLTLADYDKMFEKQNGVCAVCKQIDITGKRLAVDHNHKTGKVRGLLCQKCNIRLGVLENRNWRLLAEKYLHANRD